MNIWKIATLGAVGIVAGMYLTVVNQGRAHQSTTAKASRGESSRSVSLGSYEVRAYCPCVRCCGDWATKGYNKQGQRVASDYKPILPGDRFIASDLPRGTMVNVPGYGTVPVRGHGPSANGNRIEVFFDDDPITGCTGHQRALEWGVQVLDITQVVK